DRQLSEVTGQAFVSVDRQYHPDPADNTAYTRVNLGMDIEVQTNIEVLELGRYDRAGEKAGSSDLLIEDFSLGYINNQSYYSGKNSSVPRQRKPDGADYADGEIVPFLISNPFFEIAQDTVSNEVVGVRLGFGDAMGMLSGAIRSLTGNVNIDIVDRGEGLKNAESNGNVADQIIKALTPLLEGESPLQTKGQLVYGAEGDPNIGELDLVRGEYIGIPNGEKFVLEGASGFTRWALKNFLAGGSSSRIEVPSCNFWSCPAGDIHVYAENCLIMGIDACFELPSYSSFPIGEVTEVDGKNLLTGPVDGLFLSFQTKDLEWLKNVDKQNLSPEDFIRATQGAFFNIPNGAVQVNLQQALDGIQRLRTEYIDRGRGLF
ncbi:hypothetical protein, partial [Marinobacter sp.]|uniref:hypothetical protein n=1 Tax=Marinobacter sp. TaxID=50741 RepID=UPI003A5BD30D